MYILIAVGLMAALSASLIGDGGTSTQTQNAFQLGQKLDSQARLIRSAIQDCVLRFPEGDPAIAETGYNDPYPLTPNSGDPAYSAYDTPGSRLVSDLRCPGTKSPSSYVSLFSGSGEFSSFLPTAPSLMEEWIYYNGLRVDQYGARLDGVWIEIISSFSDPQIGDAMEDIDNNHAACEVDYIVGDDNNSCASGTRCLRYWIIRGSTTDATGGPNPCP